jgi:hypothetical protein
MPNTIFLSYRRRGESTGYAGRISDRLKRAFGDEEYFRDLDDIKPGTDFVDAIDEHMACCQVLLVVIGTDWLTLADAAGRKRIDDPRDWVRLEVASALKRKALVLPVLVGGATMPSEADLPDDLKILARRQAIDLSDTRWDYDVDRLLNRVAETAGIHRRLSVPPGPPQSSQPPPRPPRPPLWRRFVKWGAITFGGLVVLGLLLPNSVMLDQATLGATLRRGAAATIQARREVNEQYLYPAYSGAQLETELAAVRALRASNQFAVMQLESQVIQSYSVNPDGSHALADVVEVWSDVVHSSTNGACLERISRHEFPQRIFLAKSTSGWTIDSVEFYVAAPASEAC